MNIRPCQLCPLATAVLNVLLLAGYSRLALAQEAVQRSVEARETVKRIEVPGKLVNLVTRPA